MVISIKHAYWPRRRLRVNVAVSMEAHCDETALDSESSSILRMQLSV